MLLTPPFFLLSFEAVKQKATQKWPFKVTLDQRSYAELFNIDAPE